jgi:DNA (cytosine-5)-methyltransferase 1
MFDFGTRLAVPAARTIVFVEHEIYCCGVLVKQIKQERLDMAPIWSNLETFDGRKYAARADCILAGFPCTPVSKAGKRRAEKDERWLWPHVRRIIREVQPWVVFLENVPNLLKLGAEQILDELCSMGFATATGLFTSAETGGPIWNERLFILASSDPSRMEGLLASTNPGKLRQRRWDGEKDLQAIAAAPFESTGSFPQSLCRRGIDGDTFWLDRLKAIGNSVDPYQAGFAFYSLAKDLYAQHSHKHV